MTYPGVGVMLSYLSGNEDSVNVFTEAVGKTISLVSLDEDNQLKVGFTDDTAIAFYDDGQSCCENRYLVCDDDLSSFAGAVLMDAEIADAPSIITDNEYEEHEVQFLRIKTSKGAIVVSAHNEHNGYYGGFSLRVRKV